MRGGIHFFDQVFCVRKILGAAVFGILSLATVSSLVCEAHEGESGDCQTNVPPEQSIVVSIGKTETGSTIAIATDQKVKVLEPIAKVTENVPDLADPVPTLAKPQLAKKSQPAERVASVPKFPTKQKAAEQSIVDTLKAEPQTDATEEVATEENSEATVAENAPAKEKNQGPEAISFMGITPGISHRTQIFREWGDPRNEDTYEKVLNYKFKNFESVEARFDGNIVDAIVVSTEKPVPVAELKDRLGLTECRPAEIVDDAGNPIAQAFPERGVIVYAENLTASAEQKTEGFQVSKIEIHPIKVDGFILRAENDYLQAPSNSVVDLEAALKIDGNSAHARWLLSGLLLNQGKAVAAERFAAEAAEIEPENLAYRLKWARCLRFLARYDRAAQIARDVLSTEDIQPLIRAEALYEMGMLASVGSQAVSKNAVPLLQKSIEIADKEAASTDELVSLAASKLLVENHLAMALEIARGNWDQKQDVVPKWIERASALAESIIAEDETQLKLRLQVAVSALAAAASLDKPIDPLLWIEEAEQTARKLRKRTEDELIRNQIAWTLGLAYFQAAQIEHRRSESESALRLGKLADAKLADLAKVRDELPDTAYLMGRLYFQIGAVYAVHEEDHEAACEWYDEASEKLLNPVPVTTMATPQQHGDALVSMGVSYWEVGKYNLAIELTQKGVELIEEAVSNGLLTNEALVIPYGNLSAMYEAQGEAGSAEKYTKLAQKITDTKR